jgi:hypothetical protein
MRKMTNLETAVFKAHYFNSGEWTGCFTPIEVLELLELGVKPLNENIDYIKSKVKAGICNPNWFYFEPNKKFLTLKKKVGEMK